MMDRTDNYENTTTTTTTTTTLSASASSEEEWTFVQRRKSRRQNQQRKRNKPSWPTPSSFGNPKQRQDQNSNKVTFDRTRRRRRRQPFKIQQKCLFYDDHPMTFEEFQEKIKFCQILIKKSDLWKNFISTNILRIDDDRNNTRHNEKIIQHIVCYGIGNFDTLKLRGKPTPSLWQLAFILLLRDYLLPQQQQQQDNITDYDNNNTSVGNVIKMEYYEPFMTPLEATYLMKLNVNIIETNQKGCYYVSPDRTTLFFMPHCGMKLYTNLLYTNWGNNLHNLHIIGNSLQGYIDKKTYKNDDKFMKNYQILELLQPYWKETEPLLKMTSHDTLSLFDNNTTEQYDFISSFNDTCLILFPTTSTTLPDRPKDYQVNDTLDGEVI